MHKMKIPQVFTLIHLQQRELLPVYTAFPFNLSIEIPIGKNLNGTKVVFF